MRYDETDEESKNIEDRRGQGGGGMLGSSGGFPFPMPSAGGHGGFSLTTMLIIGAVMLLFGFNPLDLLRGGLGGGDGGIPFPAPRVDPGRQGGPQIPGFPRAGGEQAMRPGGGQTGDDQTKAFVAKVLKDTEVVWKQVFAGIGQRYTDPQMVLFSGATRTGCGQGLTQMGPFYCPLDQKVYLDLDFYQELERRFHAPGQFAQAYVVAHEVGHHVQTLLGISDKVMQLKENYMRRGNEPAANHLQVMMELQADCFAGVWANKANSMKNRIQPGDIESGLNAASAIGDDRLQKQATGRIVPDAFTHGTSEQRVRWFKQGITSGDVNQCDTFNAANL